MIDRFLSRFLFWILLVASLVAYDFLAAFYFVFCWLLTAFIDAKLLRKEREETLLRAGVPIEEVDGRLLPRDRMALIARGAFCFAVVTSFYFFA